MFISNYFCLYSCLLECKQVYNGLEISVLRSKASQLGEGGRAGWGSQHGLETPALMQGWPCPCTVMPIYSSDSEALAGLGPPLPGVRVWLCPESQYAGDLPSKDLEALEI